MVSRIKEVVRHKLMVMFLLCSDEAMHDDSAVLAVELDVEEMTSQS
jgi:hypothetical protein